MGKGGDYRLICGDANEVIPRLVKEGIEVDMVFCSPNPVFFSLMTKGSEVGQEGNTANVGSETKMSHYLAHLENIFKKVHLLLKESGSLWVHMMDVYMMRGSMPQVPERFAQMMSDTGPGGGHWWFLRGKRVWLRGPHEITEGNNILPWDWEYIYWFTKQEKEYVWNADSPYAKTSVINAPYEKKPRPDGGSGFPHQVVIEAMDLTTKKGDTVLDCFMGTGETGVAALTEKRKFIGIDLLPEAITLAQRRLSRLT